VHGYTFFHSNDTRPLLNAGIGFHWK
jgi:hypothetical protein